MIIGTTDDQTRRNMGENEEIKRIEDDFQTTKDELEKMLYDIRMYLTEAQTLPEQNDKPDTKQ